MSNGWGKVYGDLVFSRKWVPLSMAARGLWATMVSFSVAQKTHGNLERHWVSMLGGTEEQAAELVAAGLWEVTEDGWRFHDWEEHQGTEERMARRAEASRANGAKGGRPRKTAGDSVSQPNPTEPSENLEKPSETYGEPRKPAEQEQEQEQEILNTPLPPKGGRGDYPADFEAWWAAYPKKADKRAALKAWKQAVKRATPEQLTEAATRYAADPNREARYTKNPATWLNSDAWENDPLPAKITPLQRDRYASSAYGLLQAHAELAR